MVSHSERIELFRQHSQYAEFLAGRFARRGVALEDLQQEASIALWDATDAYDPSTHPGVPFKGFARFCIIGALARTIRTARAGGITEAPESVVCVTANLSLLPCRMPDCDELTEAIGDALGKLEPILKRLIIHRTGLDGAAPWSIIECANKFALSVATVKRLLVKARVEIGTELRAAGWDPTRWERLAEKENHIQVS